MLLCLSPVVGSLLGSLVTVCLIGLVLVVHRRHVEPHDTEQAIADLTYRLRHPWRARVKM